MGTARLMLPFRAPSPGYFLENSLMISRQVPDQVWVHTVESLSRNLEYIEEGGLGANSLLIDPTLFHESSQLVVQDDGCSLATSGYEH